MILVTATPVVEWWARRLAGPFDDPRGDILVILGSTVLDDGTVGGSSYWRSVYGARAYREGGFHQVLVSGGAGPSGASVSAAVSDFMVCQGVPRQNILLESRSGSTRENALFSRDLLRDLPGQKVLLTSDYHMYRAYRAFHKAGVPLLPRPFPDALKRCSTWRGRWPAFLDLLGESAKIVYYRMRGWA